MHTKSILVLQSERCGGGGEAGGGGRADMLPA